MAQHKPAAVLITGSPYYPMLMSRWISETLGVPVVLDFQDPWVWSDGARASRLSKAGVAYQLASSLEPRAVRYADWITSVSETQNTEMAARYSWLDATRMSAIPIGGDPDDFDALRMATNVSSTIDLRPDRINLAYVGAFLPRAGPVVRALFDAAALLSRQQPELAARLELVFVGTSNQPSGPASQIGQVTPIAAAAGVSDLVREHPQRVPFLEALGLLAKANGLLLLGSDEQHYTASKIYPALMSGRPFLSIFHRQSSSHHILSSAGGGATFAFESLAELEHLVPMIAEGLARLAADPEALGRPDPASYDPYTARSVAGRFAEVFSRVAR